jgi:hypothetical protein
MLCATHTYLCCHALPPWFIFLTQMSILYSIMRVVEVPQWIPSPSTVNMTVNVPDLRRIW